MTDQIADFLDTVESPPPSRQLVVAPVETGIDQNTQDDYELSRHNLQQLIKDGESGIERLLQVAKESESPRAFEVLANYLKTVADMNAQLMHLHAARMDADVKKAKISSASSPNKITNNNVFVGSTEELQRYLTDRDE